MLPFLSTSLGLGLGVRVRLGLGLGCLLSLHIQSHCIAVKQSSIGYAWNDMCGLTVVNKRKLRKKMKSLLIIQDVAKRGEIIVLSFSYKP